MEGHDTPPRGDESRRNRKPRHRAVQLLPEVRHWAAPEGFEIREADKAGNLVKLVGQPIMYNAPYAVRDMFGEFQETMHPGVAAEALASGADVRFLLNHAGIPMARSQAGTLTFEDTPTALRCVATLDLRSQLSNDFLIAVERGDLNQMSVGFCVGRDAWDDDMENRDVFSFSDFSDVSGVTYPASPLTSLEVAHRMAMEIPVESRARARKIYAEVRAGKVLSSGNQDKLVAAATALSAVLESAGFNPDPPEDETVEEKTDAPEIVAHEASEPVEAVEAEAEPVARSADEPVPFQPSKLATLRVQMEARNRRRKAA